MNYIDSQLNKSALAMMLPEKLVMRHAIVGNGNLLAYKGTHQAVLDTELLHLCWLVEETLYGDYEKYSQELVSEVKIGDIAVDRDYWSPPYHATWQQRVIALAKVKGIEIL
jgi:hypothetical protein